FFSSRRRHTRFSRDWSSDVCSSDLSAVAWCQVGDTFYVAWTSYLYSYHIPTDTWTRLADTLGSARSAMMVHRDGYLYLFSGEGRSEERRVGKECRSWWETYCWYEKG